MAHLLLVRHGRPAHERYSEDPELHPDASDTLAKTAKNILERISETNMVQTIALATSHVRRARETAEFLEQCLPLKDSLEVLPSAISWLLSEDSPIGANLGLGSYDAGLKSLACAMSLERELIAPHSDPTNVAFVVVTHEPVIRSLAEFYSVRPNVNDFGAVTAVTMEIPSKKG